MKTSTISRPDPTKRLQDLVTKITDFINSEELHAVTIQLSKLPENGGYTELELSYPIASVDSGALTLIGLHCATQPISVDLQSIASIDYSVSWLLITLKSGECIKVVGRCD